MNPEGGTRRLRGEGLRSIALALAAALGIVAVTPVSATPVNYAYTYDGRVLLSWVVKLVLLPRLVCMLKLHMEYMLVNRELFQQDSLGMYPIKKFTPAEVAAAKRINVAGGNLMREIQEQILLNSYVRQGVPALNKVNPIGKERMHLMPPGYRR